MLRAVKINMFINNIKRLTSPEINRNMNVTSGSMRTYTARYGNNCKWTCVDFTILTK